MERCLVSGSHGFLGEHLVSALQLQNLEVLRLERDWREIPQVDYIYHLAAYGNMYHQRDRQQMVHVNIQRTFDLLEATKDIPYKKFVYISSSSVTLPVQTLYSASKKAAEDLCSSYDKPILIVRPYSITGIGEQKEHLIPTLIDAAYTGKIIPFVPEPLHDFVDVSDIARVMIEIEKPGIYAIGSGIGYSNKEVLEMVENISRRKINIENVQSLRTYDNENWVSRRNIFYWKIKTLLEIIKEMVEDYEYRNGFK